MLPGGVFSSVSATGVTEPTPEPFSIVAGAGDGPNGPNGGGLNVKMYQLAMKN